MGVKLRMKYFFAKAAKESANVGARRTRTGSVGPPHPWIHGRRSEHLRGINSIFICAAIHSAVRVFTGEADEIAAQSYCGFCVKIFNYKALYIASLLALAKKQLALA